MRTREFNIPTGILADVADKILEHDLVNEISGSTEDGEIIVEISYEKNQREVVFDIQEIIEDYLDENGK